MTDTSNEPLDLVVVGGGIAGLVAAVAIAEAGKRVVVLERKSEDRYTNATRMCGGVFHCCLRDPRTDPDELVQAIEEATKASAPSGRIRALAYNALRSVRWLESRGIKFMRSSPYPHHAFVLSPPNISRRGLDWVGRGGDVLLRTLESRIIAHGGVVQRGFQAETLIMDGDRCVGVTGTHHEKSFEILARHVLIADGGFQSDPELVGEEIARAPEKLLQRNGQSGFGFGLRMARAVGGQISSLRGFYGHLQTRDALDNSELWPYPWWDDVAKSSIVVDGEGRRFCDERRGGIYIANRLAELDDPQSAFVIFDEAAWNTIGRRGQIAANPNFVRAGATIHWADDMNILAAKAGLDPEQLAMSVKEFNKANDEQSTARAGGKGRTISRAPFFAAPIAPGITYTMGGIVTDEHGRVLDRADSPIPGLFAAGATTGGLEGGEGVGYVGGLIKSLTGALLASEKMLSASG